jgi:hypothetical protein
MAFINTTDIIGQILDRGTQNATGNMVATLLFILLFLVVICLMFSIPLEFASIILLPLCLACASYYSDFFKPLIVILIYICMIIAKNWLFK